MSRNHGTHATYCEGCRCGACKEGHRRYAILRDLSPAPLTVDSTGTARRIQALAALGWSYRELAQRLDVTWPRVGHLARQVHTSVTKAVHDQVADMYRDLCMTLPPAETKAQRYAVTRAKQSAAERGWAAPLAWDDIDNDPAPTGIRTTSNHTGVDLDEIERLISFGESIHSATRQMGVTINAVARAANRTGRARLAHIAYAARAGERNNQNGAAA